MKPVRLPASATIALPRWSLFALCLLYVIPGLIGLVPIKGVDASGFGIMWTMAHGTMNDWLFPNIVGMPMPNEGPLAFWLGALSIKLFGSFLGDPLAARMATGFVFIFSIFSVWLATYHLGCRPEAQPLKLAFGGQPEPKDFGRTLADGAVLIYLGCLGLLLPSHTTSTSPLHIALIAYLMYVCIRFFDQPQKRTAIQMGLVLALIVLTRGWVLPLSLLLILMVLCFYRRQNLFLPIFTITIPIAALIIATWLFIIYNEQPYNSSMYQAWMQWNWRQISFPSTGNILYFFKYGIWFAWPAWPFAAWAIYAWRKQEKALHISLPVSFLICFILLALLNPNHEEGILLPLLVPLAILAAFGLPTMKRSAINAVDWFAVMVLTGAAGFFWFAWIALQTGWPAKMSATALKWAPGFLPEINLFTLIIALTVTIIWFRIVYWRISRQPSVLWRAVVLSSGGVILCWFLFMSLWLPLINHRVSYSVVARDMAAKINVPYRCIDSKMGSSQRALFAYFSGLHFASFTEKNCDLLLKQGNHRFKENAKNGVDKEFLLDWELIWQGQRLADKDEFFTLYKKKIK